MNQRLADAYQNLLAAEDKTIGQWDELAALGDRLFEIGYIKKRTTLNKSLMPKRLRARLAR